MAIPKVISEGKIHLSDDVEITFCVLDDGRRIIPKEDTIKALQFLGLNELEINQILKNKTKI